jgi:large subunit ribosomal protein L23
MPKAIHPYEVLRRPIVTEKSTALAAQRQYVFEVAPGANKPQIREAVEKAFSVKVENVNTMRGHEKRKRTRQGRMSSQEPALFKKAVVTLAAGQTIEFFEGV